MNARLLAELRPVGFAVAYRMLGSVSEAEDIVQEAFLLAGAAGGVPVGGRGRTCLDHRTRSG